MTDIIYGVALIGAIPYGIKGGKMFRILWALFLAVTASIFAAANAHADIIQIPAIAFTARSNSTEIGTAQEGTMTNAAGKFYAAVPFTTNGHRVCRFTLVHRDNDADSAVTARLMRKKILVGSNAFEAPAQMAGVSTGVATATQFVAKKNDTTIHQPVIDLNNAFYFVELEFGSTLLEALGVQIEVGPSCL